MTSTATLTATPLAMPRRKPVLVPSVEVVYTTRTGDQPRPVHAARRPAPSAEPLADLHGAHCFVCHRHTDHAGEHDALVEAGMATYAADGSVYKTDAYDAEQAKVIAEAEYQRLYGHLGR